MTQAYPLLWPEGWPRTKNRSPGQYRTGLPGALKNLRDQLRMLCGDAAAKTLVMSSNITLGVEAPADPGVVAYFTWDGQAMAIPCDRWSKVEHNVQAIGLTIEAMRAMDRHGAKHMIRAMFRGFTALPAPGAGQRHWRTVLGIGATDPVDVAAIEALRRTLARQHHPDAPGGNADRMAEINAACDQAVRELS